VYTQRHLQHPGLEDGATGRWLRNLILLEMIPRNLEEGVFYLLLIRDDILQVDQSCGILTWKVTLVRKYVESLEAKLGHALLRFSIVESRQVEG
jgi:hypothetical protein